MPKRSLRHVASALPVLAALAGLVGACIPPPPKIASIPASGLSLRVFAFGAMAESSIQGFRSVKDNNPSFAIVPQGGDGEVLVGFEQDTGACVEPTALCTMRVSWRVKNAKGEVVRAETELVSANDTSCSLICEKAMSNAITKIVDGAAIALKGGVAAAAPAAAEPAPSAEADPKDPKAKKPPPVAAAGKANGICAVGTGPRLPSDEAERRVGQVEALKRLGVIEQDEADCLKKAYLARL